LEKVNKANITKRLKEVKTQDFASPDEEQKKEIEILKQYLDLLTQQTATNKKIKTAEKELDEKLYAKYPTLNETEVKQLVVDDKWMQTIEAAIKVEIDHISQHLTNRIKELAERYETPLPEIAVRLSEVEAKVNAHLEKMGFKAIINGEL
jgi:type I restriction enzyme M protein